MSRLLETAEILKQLNALWDEHASHINKANTSLKNMLNTANKQSAYISTLKSISDAQEAIIKSTQRLNSTTKAHADAMRSVTTQKAAALQVNKQLANSVADLEKKLARVNKELANMKAANAATTASNNAHATSIDKLSSKVDNLTGKLNNANVAVRKVGAGAAFTFGTVSSLMGAFGISTGIYLFASIAKDIYETTKQLQSLDLALKMVSDTEQKYGENKSFITQVSQKWGLEIKSLTQQYIQFYTASKGLLSDRAIESTFEGIAKAGAVMGLSLEKQSAAFYAIDQMMSKGTVTSEELKKQLGNAMPGAIKAAAMAYMDLHPQIKSIGEAEAELYKAMKKGAVDSATYVPLIVANFQKLYGIENLNSINTLVAKQNNLSNSWTSMVRSMNESETGGISKFFGYLITAATNALNLLTRLNDSWGEIYNKTEQKGFEFGKEVFNNSITGLSESQIKDKMEAESKVIYKEMRKAMQKVIDLQNELRESNPLALTNPFAPSRRDKKSAIEKLRNDIAQAEGYLKAYEDYLNKNKVTTTLSGEGDETESGNNARRERIKLNFDWIKSEYELKKAILETARVQSGFDMNDETKTLAKRTEARVRYTEKSMELLKLESDMEKAINTEKYLNDIERNDVALRNKDINEKEHAQNILDLNKRINFEQLKVDETYSQKWQELLHSNLEFYKKINDKKLEYSKRTSRAEIDFYKQTLQEIINSKSASDNEVIQAAQDLRTVEYNEALKERDRQLQLAGEEADLKTAIYAEYAKIIQDINNRLNATLEANHQKRIQREMEIVQLEREAKGSTTVMNEYIPGFLEGLPDNLTSQYEELLNNYKLAVAGGEQDVIAERKRQLDEFIAYVKSINEYATGFFEEFVNNSGFQTLFSILGGQVKGFGEDWKTTFLGITQMAQEFVNFMSQNSQAYFDAERTRLDERYQYEIALAGDNQAARIDIDRQFEQRRRDIANREAKAQKDLAIFNIAINTAQAIMGLWVKPGFPAAIPMAIAVGALGALQIAMVASRPLPQFYKGTENSPEGFAWVDEQGPEIHTDKHGIVKDLGSNRGPRIKYLSQGDKIIPAQKSANMLTQESFLGQLDNMLFGNNITYSDNKNNKLDDAGIINSINSLKQSIENKEAYEEHYDERGWTKFKKINGQKIEDKNNRIRFKRRD